MKHLMVLALAIAAGSVTAGAQSFSECPAIGNDTTGCEFLVNITAPATFTVSTSNPDLGPYDGSDDTLVGVLNSSSATVASIHLSSTTDIFAFDGDGACATLGSACSDPSDPSGYGGPGVTFSNIDPVNQEFGDVDFAGGLAPGATAWFSLEEALTASQIGTPGPPPTTGPTAVTPEPNSLLLLGTGMLGVAGVVRRRLIA